MRFLYVLMARGADVFLQNAYLQEKRREKGKRGSSTAGGKISQESGRRFTAAGNRQTQTDTERLTNRQTGNGAVLGLLRQAPWLCGRLLLLHAGCRHTLPAAAHHTVDALPVPISLTNTKSRTALGQTHKHTADRKKQDIPVYIWQESVACCTCPRLLHLLLPATAAAPAPCICFCLCCVCCHCTCPRLLRLFLPLLLLLLAYLQLLRLLLPPLPLLLLLTLTILHAGACCRGTGQ